MTQIQFIKELDELGLSIKNTHFGVVVLMGDRVISTDNETLKLLTYQNRIDIIRECKRNLR